MFRWICLVLSCGVCFVPVRILYCSLSPLHLYTSHFIQVVMTIVFYVLIYMIILNCALHYILFVLNTSVLLCMISYVGDIGKVTTPYKICFFHVVIIFFIVNMYERRKHYFLSTQKRKLFIGILVESLTCIYFFSI